MLYSNVYIDAFGYEDCPGHPVWLPPSEWLGTASDAAPLHLVSPQPGDKLHSQLECALADIEGTRPAPLTIHPDDAQKTYFQSQPRTAPATMGPTKPPMLTIM